MANQDRNGRNAHGPDDNRPGWRPQDEPGQRRGNLTEDDVRTMRDRDEDDRYMSRDRFSHWDDRIIRPYERDDRSTERYGQGQSGYRAGRYEDDRSYLAQPNLGARGEWRDSYPFDRGYGDYQDRDDESRDQGRGNYLGQGGQEMGYERDDPRWGNEGYMAQRGYGSRHRGWQDDPRMPSNYGQPSQFGPRGSQGYQGFGQPSHRGKGPSGYARSDERIRELVCEALTDDHYVDATHIEITVRDGEVTLSGTVDDRQQKRMAEDCVDQVWGVRDVQNQIRVASDKNRMATSKQSESTETPGSSTTNDKRGRA
ncbi:MAG TPA: BON domain-containing protein [Kofleriaceae bacterium]